MDRTIKLWIVSDAMPVIDQPPDKTNIRQRVQQYLYSRGPVDVDRIQNDLKLSQRDVQDALITFLQEKKVVRGQLTIGHLEEQSVIDKTSCSKTYASSVLMAGPNETITIVIRAPMV